MVTYHKSGSLLALRQSNTFKLIILFDVQRVVASQKQFLELVNLLAPLLLP